MMNINELLNKANEVIAEANEEIKETNEEIKKDIESSIVWTVPKDEQFAEAIKEKVDLVKDLEGINIMKMGIWIWIDGKTENVKTELEDAGFKYHSKKDMWYFNPDSSYKKKTNRYMSKQRIAMKHGVEIIKGEL